MTDARYTCQSIISTRVWLPGRLITLRVQRHVNFTFTAGQFARLGLPSGNNPRASPGLWRAYSISSAPHEPWLEFYSTIVPKGEFSNRIALLESGELLYVEKKAYGFLTLRCFSGGEILWLLATGTGLSTYISILRDPVTWRSFRRIVLVHSVRTTNELSYRKEINLLCEKDSISSNAFKRNGKLVYVPIVTREVVPNMLHDRLTTLIESRTLEKITGETLDPERSRIMLCGNPNMISETRNLLAKHGFITGRRGVLGNLAVENYW